jgi:hypothetical protein
MTELAAVDGGQRKPFERAVSDTDRSWHAFTVYRDLGPRRTFAKVAEVLGQSPYTVSGYSRHHDWPERIEAFDLENDRVRREAQVEALEEMGERHASLAQAQTVALTFPAKVFLQRLAEDQEAVMAELAVMPISELVGLIQRVSGTLPAVFNAERLARGLATERTESLERVEVTIDDNRGIDFDELMGILAEVRLDPSDFGTESGVAEAIEAEAHEIHTSRPDATPIDLPEPPP